ncbi:MAG: hypothetical protein ACI36Z_01365 [Alloprevotella sp.]
MKEYMMDEETKKLYDALSEFADKDNPIDPYTFRVSEEDSNDEARLYSFSFDGFESCCLMYKDGTVLTPVDWQAPAYPKSMDELEDFRWMDCKMRDAFMLNGMPRILNA